MEQDGTWGDHVILYATANCYKTCIDVISSRSNHSDLTIRPDGHVVSTNPLVLGHVHEIHYVSLKPKQGESLNNTLCYKYGLLTKFEVKMVGYWPRSFFAFLWTDMKLRSINSQKKNKANIQPS